MSEGACVIFGVNYESDTDGNSNGLVCVCVCKKKTEQ